MKFFISPSKFGFFVFATLFLGAVFYIEKINGRFWLNDFKVYYSAAQAFLNGEKIYGTPFGLATGFYKYSPFVLLLFTPYCFFTFETASVIHFIVLSASAIGSVIVINNIIGKYIFPKRNEKEIILMSLSLLCIAVHLTRELHLGNVNIVVLLLVSVALRYILKSNFKASGIFIAFAIIIKPYFCFLFFPLFVFKKWKTIFSVGLSLSIFILTTILIFGFSRSYSMHQEWIQSMLEHGNYLQSSHTIPSLIQNYFHPSLLGYSQFAVIAALSSLFMIFFGIKRKGILKKENPEQEEGIIFIIAYLVSISLIPNLVITDTEHFLWSLPLIMILLYYFSLLKSYFGYTAFIILLFFFGGNSTDLLGKSLSAKFDELGLLGISNLFIIALVLYLFSFRNKTMKQFSIDEYN